MNAERTEITLHAVKCFVHFLRDSRRNGPRETGEPTDRELDYARRKLNEILPTATYRETDRQHRELWRSPPRAYNLRWLMICERDIRKVVWVGASRPPQSMWAPKEPA